MSTFDGYVKEFPNIRIDYFRTHTDKPPPAACFLSHVHSDHLTGLDSHKMPFVYCSATTRRLLLRMEKYPHRVNFAKGILESRIQHYRHLKLVLRALPLQTATEIELAPKCKIRVTLIDANHCPGAVMFLIEDDNRAILYTGDVRAEPWWVNSIVQNPFLLPYTCGHKHLDCIYLDTTFSTRDEKYRDFPTKADGLKELLAKVSILPHDTIFYFRAWTLGYEQVWIALSNLLRCQVHVDEYQIQLFNGIIEGGRDGFSTFEGPSLAGFTVGNQFQPGCLSLSSETRLHSCEPGSDCHTVLKKKKNVVWITPIISRLDDGSELLELGAGGGMGDLYQTSDLELNDMATLDAFVQLCRNTADNKSLQQKFAQLTKTVQQSGSFKFSLDGLGLDTKGEISLDEFVQSASSKETLPGTTLKPSNSTVRGSFRARTQDQIIHFPFSRHSSYEELRELVSVFRPKDVCPCTVDPEVWTEELSMQSLFGDLCSDSTFYHDKIIEAEVEMVREAQQISNGLKRKRQGGTQKSSQGSQNERENSQREVFISARASAVSTPERMTGDKHPPETVEENPIVQQRLPAPESGEAAQRTHSRPWVKPNVQDIKAAFLALNNGSDLITRTSIEETAAQDDGSDTEPSQQSSSLSAFESQNWLEDQTVRIPQLDGDQDTTCGRKEPDKTWGKRNRLVNRKAAHDAASKAIGHGENEHWHNLNLRSVGRRGHSDREIEL